MTSITSRSAKISWNDPEDHRKCNLTRCKIKLMKEGSLILNITKKKLNEHEIRNLMPYTIYEIAVAVGNKSGFGMEATYSFSTREEGEC